VTAGVVVGTIRAVGGSEADDALLDTSEEPSAAHAPVEVELFEVEEDEPGEQSNSADEYELKRESELRNEGELSEDSRE
jgi:hypothetical protein